MSLFKAFLVAAMVVLPLWMGDAYGHVYPERCEPRVGETLTVPPAWVRIWFDGSLENTFSTIYVQKWNGERVDKGDSRVNPEDKALLETSLFNLSPGVYRVVWSVVGLDGHKTHGSYSFTLK